MADEKKLYLVHSTLDHDKRYENGDTVHLTDGVAAPLLQSNVVTLHEAADGSGADDVALTTLKKDQLLEIAAKLNINLPGNSSKDSIIAAIAEARAAAEQK